MTNRRKSFIFLCHYFLNAAAENRQFGIKWQISSICIKSFLNMSVDDIAIFDVDQ